MMKKFELRFTDWQEKDYYVITIEQKTMYRWQLSSNIWGEALINVDYQAPEYSAKKIKDTLTDIFFNFDLKGYSIHWADTAGFVLTTLIGVSEERLTQENAQSRFDQWSRLITDYNKRIKEEGIY